MGLLTALAIGTAVAGGLGSLGNTAYQHWNNAKNRQTTIDLQEDAQKHDKEVRQNQYQWTKTDMEKAGLNPAMMYGSAGTPSGSSATGSSVNTNGAGTIDGINSTANLINSAANVLNSSHKNSEPYEIATKILTSASKILNK